MYIPLKKHPTLHSGVKSGVDCANARYSSVLAEREVYEPISRKIRIIKVINIPKCRIVTTQ